MQQLGLLLKNVREQQKLSIAEVSKRIRIRPSYIASIEAGDYDLGISEIYVKGYIKSYAKFLGVDQRKVEAMYRRDKQQEIEEQKLDVKEPVMKSFYILKPKNIYIGASLFIALLFLGLIAFQLISIFSSPDLFLEEPVVLNIKGRIGSQQTATEIAIENNEESILVSGRSEDNALVKINDIQVTLNSENRFSQEVFISEGVSQVKIIAENGFNRNTEVIITVFKK